MTCSRPLANRTQSSAPFARRLLDRKPPLGDRGSRGWRQLIRALLEPAVTGETRHPALLCEHPKNGAGGACMESRAKLLGHPIHPMLIVFPLGLLATAVAFDVVAMVQGNQSWFHISFWMIAAGIVGGLLAAVFGLIDWLAIPNGTRAKRIGFLHGAVNVVVV